MKSGRSGTLKPDRLGLSCKANKCSGAGVDDLGVLTTQETSSMDITTGVTDSSVPGECCHNYIQVSKGLIFLLLFLGKTAFLE